MFFLFIYFHYLENLLKDYNIMHCHTEVFMQKPFTPIHVCVTTG